ncbi:hypothetical protein [Streptomyces malaysiensis]|uniref:Uncharacterized protein n=1 Tax=Streptomyces malaysiensis subsp. samsunensis TaxID=459658 RepID=A0A9X2LYJ1_STRMQ|nr:hypothetical protein [Streptomyces samsunensis]MCQ8831846.1 hypothetical protein [Streptomyces samsunensis]
MRIKVRTTKGTQIDVQATPTDTPGLVAHRRLCQESAHEQWIVTHVQSGKHLGWDFWSELEALNFARDVGPLADWQQRLTELPEHEAISRIARRHVGRDTPGSAYRRLAAERKAGE